MRIKCADPAACKEIASQLEPLVTSLVVTTVFVVVVIAAYRLHSSKHEARNNAE